MKTGYFSPALLALLISVNSFAADAKNALEKIEASRASGKISEFDAMGLRWLASLSESTLPTEFVSDSGAAAATPLERRETADSLAREVQEQLPKMSLDVASRVYLMLLPPPYRPSQTQFKTFLAADPIPVPSEAPSQNWAYLDNVAEGLRVWYLKDSAPQLAAALRILRNLSGTSMPALKGLMGRSHISDDDSSIGRRLLVQAGIERDMPNGGDGKFDVYLFELDALPSGLIPLAWVSPYTATSGACPARAGYMGVDLSWALNAPETDLRSVLAHEYMHAVQFAFPKREHCTKYSLMNEGVSDWAMHFVYPKDDYEHLTGAIFSSNGLMSLQDTDYDSWPFYFYVAELLGSDKIRAIYAATANHSAMSSVDEALTGGFKKHWLEYAVYEWNQEPVMDSFKQWDRYRITPGRGNAASKQQIPPMPVELVTLNSDGYFRKELALKMGPLTREFYPFSIKDPEVRSIAIENPVFGASSYVRAKALVRRKGSNAMQELVWADDNRREYQFCLDPRAPEDEQIEDIVIVVTNYSFGSGAKTHRRGPVFKATNQGCQEFRGEMHSKWRVKDSGQEHSLDVDATDLVFRQIGRNTLGHFKGNFSTVSGTVQYSYKGSYGDCKGFAAGVLPVAGFSNRGYDLSIASYNVPPESWGSYSVGVRLKQNFFDVTYICPDGSPVVQPVNIQLSSGLAQHHGKARLKDSATDGDWTVEWDLAP